MATRTWSSAGSTDGNNTANYSGAGAFLTTDDLVWNGTSVVNCTFTAVLSVKSLTVAAAYTGTFNDGGYTLTLAGGFDFSSGGTVTLTGRIKITATGTWKSSVDLNDFEAANTTTTTGTVSGTLTIAGTIYSSATTATTLNGGTLEIKGNVDISAGYTFGAGTTDFQATSTGNQTWKTATRYFGPTSASTGNTFTINKPSGTITFTSAALTYLSAGNFTINGGTIDCGTAGCQISVTNFLFDGGTWTGGSANNYFGGMTTFELRSGTWSCTTATTGCAPTNNFSKSLIINSAVTWSHNNGTWFAAAVGLAPTICPFDPGGKSFYNLNVSGNNNRGVYRLDGTLTVLNNLLCGVTSQVYGDAQGHSALDANGNTINVTGTFTIGRFYLTGDETITYGTLVIATDSLVRYNATSSSHNIKAWSYWYLEINGSGGTFNLPGNTTCTGTTMYPARFAMVAGTFGLNGYTLSADGFAYIGGTVTLPFVITFTGGTAFTFPAAADVIST